MDELRALAETAGAEAVAMTLQRRPAPDARTFIGEGKAEEVKALADANDASLILFDNELSPSQMSNLEELTGRTVLDRSALILDIFAQRARTGEGKLQVELAQYQYILPRLAGMGKAMSRLGGGIGTRGPGESKLESDRRHIRSRIDKLRRDLEQVRQVRAVQRRQRKKTELPMVAIVGYTNAGKSTLLNTLTGAGIEANDRLFDTLDPTTRKKRISDTQEILLSDTVGFIRKLPASSGLGVQGDARRACLCRPAAARGRRFRRGLAGAGGNRGQGHRAARRTGHSAPYGLQQGGQVRSGRHPVLSPGRGR